MRTFDEALERSRDAYRIGYAERAEPVKGTNQHADFGVVLHAYTKHDLAAYWLGAYHADRRAR